MDSKLTEIKVADNARYGRVAFLVDRDDFIADIKKLRQKWGIYELIPYGELYKWQDDKFKVSEKQKIWYGKSWKEFQQKWKVSLGDPVPIEATGDWKKVHRSLPFWDLYFDVEEVLKKFNKTSDYHWVIRRVLICGEVHDEDFGVVNLDTKLSVNVFTGLSAEQAAFIKITPETTLNEVKSVFSNYRRGLISKDTVSNVKRDRNWYWLHLGGLSYKEVVDRELVKGTNRDAVIKAVLQYKRRLGVWKFR